MISKKINGKVYYYLAVSGRVEGKPRIVEQQYLGTAEDIAAAMAGVTAVPTRSKHLAFGDLAAAWWVVEKLKVVETVDAVVGGRRSDAGASVGTYLALAAINRVVDPCSKRAFASWWATTAGDHLLKIRASALDHRRFWDAMHAVDAAALARIEARLTQRMIEVFALDVSCLALDMTNFATFIDSTNTKAPIAQRGKAKQKRFDLRLVGLGLVITRDGGVPLLSHAYPGNHNDVSQFATMIDELAQRHHCLSGQAGELTVVFDAGQNSEANFTELTGQGLHYVGSVPPCDQPALLAIPRTHYQALDQFDGLHATEVSVTALGRTHRGVLTHSAKAARRPIPRPDPNPRQGRPRADPDRRHPRPRPRPAHPNPAPGSPRQDHEQTVRTRDRHLHPHRRHPQHLPAELDHRRRHPERPRRKDLR
ncbi:MAG: IS1634 family transposase [Actinobacteria bacterium]|nr:IS1634 family transposase [Actinomycetota bacterium]